MCSTADRTEASLSPWEGLRTGDVAVLGDDDPLRQEPTANLHGRTRVYGGDLPPRPERSEWTDETFEEIDYEASMGRAPLRGCQPQRSIHRRRIADEQTAPRLPRSDRLRPGAIVLRVDSSLRVVRHTRGRHVASRESIVVPKICGRTRASPRRLLLTDVLSGFCKEPFSGRTMVDGGLGLHESGSLRTCSVARGSGCTPGGVDPAFVSRHALSLPIVVVALGVVVFLLPLDFDSPNPTSNVEVTERLTELGVIVALMAPG